MIFASKKLTHLDSEDLIITKGKKKKRAWIIGTVVGLVVIAVVVALVVVLTSNRNKVTEPAISLEDFLDGKLSPKSFNASWLSGNKLFYKNTEGTLVLYNIGDQSIEEILPASSEVLKSAFNYELSADNNFLLIAHDYQKIYRHTYLARYTIYDLINSREYVLDGENSFLQYASWGPIGNSLVYVLNNNILYKQTALAASVFEVTADGLQGQIYNGIPDWVYEEEVFGSNNALWFSSDGKKLAYAKFNDNTTSLMTIPFYGVPGSLTSQYTQLHSIRYPKPGTTNPEVSLHVCDLVTSFTLDLEVPSGLSEEILTAVSWATDTELVSIWMNRVQNEAYIVSYDTTSNTSGNSKIINNRKEEGGWLDLFTPPTFSKDGSQMLLILSHNQGNSAGSYRHVTRFERMENVNGEAITSGKFVVTQILGWDEDKNLIYYEATTEDPAIQHIYSISTNTKVITCLSCKVTTTIKKEECRYNFAKFSNDFSYYVLNCAGPGYPEISIFNSSDNNRIVVWENNKQLINYLGTTSLPGSQRLVFNITDGFTAQVYLKLPPNIDKSGNTKYPMVVNVYGGPDSYQVLEKFSLDWGSYLAANKSIIYATIDGRGSGLKGDKSLFSIYRKLGTVEIADQIDVTKQIQETVPYVDGTRTAIWGWSYGGYAAGLALATDTENIFKCGMSVAPVTDWTLYDSIYTERFMGLPTYEDNAEGYQNAKLLERYNGIRNKEYFLIHGTFDDNVHYQQSMLWSKVLEHQDIMFRQQSYPDEDHGLGSVRPHLYHSLENFLDDCFIENV